MPQPQNARRKEPPAPAETPDQSSTAHLPAAISQEEILCTRAWLAIRLMPERVENARREGSSFVETLYIFDDPAWKEKDIKAAADFTFKTYAQFSLLLLEAGIAPHIRKNGTGPTLLASIRIKVSELSDEDFKARYQRLVELAPSFLGPEVPCNPAGLSKGESESNSAEGLTPGVKTIVVTSPKIPRQPRIIRPPGFPDTPAA